MPATTTRFQLAEALNTMSFRDLKLFGDDIVNMLAEKSCDSALDWATLLSDWAEAALDCEAEEVSEAAKAA